MLSQKPAEIGRLEGHPASLEVDQAADLVLVDPTASSVFSVADLKGMSHNSPCLDMELPGRVAYTVRRGYLTLDDGELVGAPEAAPADQPGVAVFSLTAAAEPAARAALAKAVVDSGAGLVELTPIAQSLEEVFVQLITSESGAAPVAEAEAPAGEDAA